MPPYTVSCDPLLLYCGVKQFSRTVLSDNTFSYFPWINTIILSFLEIIILFNYFLALLHCLSSITDKWVSISLMILFVYAGVKLLILH